jgi:hypothetical protein
MKLRGEKLYLVFNCSNSIEQIDGHSKYPFWYDKRRERGRKGQESSRLYLSNPGNDMSYKLNA